MFYVNLHEFKLTQAMDCINLNMIIHKYELLPGLIGAGIDGLAYICKDRLSSNPRSGTLFVFINRSRTMVRTLVYDGTGFWLMTKRLSKGKFQHWPKSNNAINPVAAKQLRQLLLGNESSLFWEKLK